jgi:DNA-binding IclR family transcriptional regulator
MISFNARLFHSMKYEALKHELSFYNRSLERALQILCSFNVETQSFSLGQLSKVVNLPKPTVFRLCSTLTKYDFLKFDHDAKQYSLGFKLFELGGVVFSSLSLRRLASPYLDELQIRTGKTIFIGVLRDDVLIYLDKKEDLRNPIRFASHIGTRRPPYFGMLGQLLMAYLSENEVDRLLEKHPLTLITRKSITDPKVFKERLRRIREQGYSVDEEEAIDGVTGVAVPVWDFTGKVVVGVGVGFISSSVETKGVARIKNELVKTAKEISRELGYLAKTKAVKAQATK